MKTISELTDFYYKSLYPVLQELEGDRKAVKKKVINFGIIYGVIVATIAFASFKYFDLDVLFFMGVFALVGFGWLYRFLVSDYTDDFKQKIIAPLIHEIDENLEYTPDLHIPIAHFKNSKLFTSRPDRVSGNDYVHGKIDGIDIAFSDFHAEKRHKDSKGRETWSTIFQGLFIVSDFHKNFYGETIILPDYAQSTFGNLIGSWLQTNNFSRKQLVKMDSPAFEKAFVVYGTDQIEARYILTHTLMQKLLNYKKRSKHPLYVSFIRGKIYMAIEYNEDMFEPAVFRSLLNYKIAMEYVATLHLAIGIVEELKLNQKLWSKI
ncbi:Possible Galanin [hydrothermal vent metagenome]|uniref:Possible Galanin n=1 Tax=hydrothermal vent metagenome TaxID=652676 RepID=A0A1W1CWF3_9ZZZZ